MQPVLLVGGAGTRLWPASDASTPKPFLPIVDGRSTLGATLARIADPATFAPPLILARAEHRHLVAAALAEAGMADTVILEPEPAGTAGAIAIAARWAAGRDPDALILCLAGDHVVGDEAGFRRTVVAGADAAASGRVVVFGIRPTRPETGYGYIRPRARAIRPREMTDVEAFHEKPDPDEAGRLVAEGCLWNSGDVLMRATTAVDEIRRHAPATAAAAARALDDAEVGGDTILLALGPLAAALPISFDRAVLEKTDRASVIAAAFDWADIGTWASIWGASHRDGNGNTAAGAVALVDTAGSLVRSDGPTVGVVGLRDTIVVAANNAVLVVPRDQAGRVNHLAEALAGVETALAAGRDRQHRPRGHARVLDAGPAHRVKRIVIDPGARLSLRKRRHAGHWTVVAGTAEVSLDATTHTIGESRSIFIPPGAAHSAANPGSTPTVIIGVECGDRLGEDDMPGAADEGSR